MASLHVAPNRRYVTDSSVEQQARESHRLCIGLVMNPLAGLGGAVALKGSDGEEIVSRAIALGAKSHVAERVRACLEGLGDRTGDADWITVGGNMGAELLSVMNIEHRVVFEPASDPTTAADTRGAVEKFQAEAVDLVLFAGGDGTARDICEVVHDDQVVLGIPCGVKMHSGVFANTPAAAARILEAMIAGELVTVMQGEVRDLDEDSFREGIVKTKFHGELWVPEELRYLQQVKSGGREVEELAVQEIAADVVEKMEPGVTYFIGSGSTTVPINESLGLEHTLLGVDVIRDGDLLLADANESALLEFAEQGPCHIVVTVIGGQGHIFGRGNQQLSPAVLKAVGLSNLTVIATKTKLEELAGRPLQVDTGDAEVDAALAGTIRVVTGYEDAVLYPVAG